MAVARPKEGPRAPLFYSLALVLAWACPAASQTVDLSELEGCAGLATDESKLACFEAIIATRSRAAASTDEPDIDVATEPAVVATVPETAAAPAPATVAVTAEPDAMTGSGTEPVVAAAESESAESVVDSFGSEHLQNDDPGELQELSATVVEVTRSGRGALVFHLDNGQVWRQIEPRYFPYPKDRGFDVTISTGVLGAYQLRVEGTGRKVTIRRVK